MANGKRSKQNVVRELRELAKESFEAARRADIDNRYACFEQTLQIAQKILAIAGETPEELRGVSVCLFQLADIGRDRGQFEAAYARYEQSLQFLQRI